MRRSRGAAWFRLLLVFGIAGALTEGNRTAMTTCHYQENDVTKPCELFRKVECKDIAYEPEQYDSYVLREGKLDGELYNNVTFFALWHGKGSLGINGTDECWQFEVGSTPHPEEYVSMDWDFFRDVSAENMQIYRDGGRCGYLHSSNYSFQVYTSEGAKLAFVFHPVSGVREVKLNLIGGDCEINCDGSSSNCSMPLDSSTMKDFSKPQYFADLKYRYYCIRVLHGACAIHTVTIKIEDPPPPPTPTASEESVQPGVILLTTGTIVAVVLVAVFVKKRYCDDPFRPEPVDTKEPDAPTQWPSSPTLQKVLLLYSRDCPQFCEVARALGQLLQSFGNLKVLDPLQQNEMERVSENISGWLTQHLQSPDVKLVIVVSEGAMLRQNALLNNQLVHNDQPHFLDPVFTLALQQMHERPQLGNDYKRIFPVRFEDFTPSEVSLSLIVPLKCYVLQRHLGKIIAELGQCNSAPEAGYEDIRRICPQELRQLESAIRDMKSYCADNPHYLKDNFLLVAHK